MAYLRARRSIKVAPGFKINLNKHSVGVTVGTRGAHYSVNSSGRRTSTVGLPGTGLSIVETHSAHKRSQPSRRPRSQRSTVVAPAVSRPPSKGKHHAGVFASHHERAYAKALDCLRKGKTADAYVLLDEAVASDAKHEAVAAHFVSAIAHYKSGELDAAISHLEAVVSAPIDAHDDMLLHRYELPQGYGQFDVEIGQLQATAGTNAQGPVYLLVAAYAKTGRLKEAAGVMQKLITVTTQRGRSTRSRSSSSASSTSSSMTGRRSSTSSPTSTSATLTTAPSCYAPTRQSRWRTTTSPTRPSRCLRTA